MLIFMRKKYLTDAVRAIRVIPLYSLYILSEY